MKTSIVGMLLVGVLSQPLAASSLKGSVSVSGLRNGGGVVVYAVPTSGAVPAASSTASRMDQVDSVFLPGVLAVQVGQEVEFNNSDPMAHNVFTPDKCAGRFDLGSWGKGEARSQLFDEACMAVILCNIHPEMEAWVAAVPTPYFAVTDASGQYVIGDLPEGDYEVRAWHNRVKAQAAQKVTVSGDATVDFSLASR